MIISMGKAMAHFHRRKDANIKLNNHEMKEVEEEITE
jgi:hypothetical protein